MRWLEPPPLQLESRPDPDRKRKGRKKNDQPPVRSGPDLVEYERKVRKAVKLAYHLGEAQARELRAVGVRWNLAPVLDLDNPRSEVLKGRCLGKDPEWVSEVGLALMAGLQDNGVIACGKHFPGHGATDQDSHSCLPRSGLESEEVVLDHARPFARAMANGLRSLMVGHVIYPGLDSDHPASLSGSIVTGMARKAFRFDGLVITDDLGMGAIKNNYDIGEAACLAVRAGVDVIMVKDQEDQVKAYEAVVKAVEKNKFGEERLYASLKRVYREKRLPGLTSPPAPAERKKVIGSKEHKKLAQEIKDLARELDSG